MSGRNLLLVLVLVALSQGATSEPNQSIAAGEVDDPDVTVTPMPATNIVEDVTETSTEEVSPSSDVGVDSDYPEEANGDEELPSGSLILEAEEPPDEDLAQVVDYVVDDSLSRPRNLQVLASTQRSITVRWEAPQPEVGLTGYRVFYENGFTELSNTTDYLENQFEIQHLGNQIISKFPTELKCTAALGHHLVFGVINNFSETFSDLDSCKFAIQHLEIALNTIEKSH